MSGGGVGADGGYGGRANIASANVPPGRTTTELLQRVRTQLGKGFPALSPPIRSFLQTPRFGKDLTELPLAGKAFIATVLLVLIGGIGRRRPR